MSWKRYISPEEAAIKRGVTTATIRKWLREGDIQGIKMGRLWRVLDEEGSDGKALETREIDLMKKATDELKSSMETLGELIQGGGNIQVIRAVCSLLPHLEEATAKMAALSEMMSQIGKSQRDGD